MENQPAHTGVAPTPEHFKPFELAARIYCEKTGINPDALMTLQNPATLDFFDVPRWHSVADRLLDLSTLLSAMKEAKETPAIFTGRRPS